MSYESEMLRKYKMPSQKDVEKALLIFLFNNEGIVKEFGDGVQTDQDISDYFKLTESQRNAYLETIYRKENRLKRSSLWHRLLFRAAYSLAQDNLIIRPSKTIILTGKKEWMLTEEGYDKALKLLGIPKSQKEILNVKSFETQKIVNRISTVERPIKYNPFEEKKKSVITKEIKIRNRGFRLAVLGIYENKCAVCGLKKNSLRKNEWEVEAAHIVPYKSQGKDDIWNGIALCHLHHWAFDAGWFSLDTNYKIQTSSMLDNVPEDIGRINAYEFLNQLKSENLKLPSSKNHYPHPIAIQWHYENIFYK